VACPGAAAADAPEQWLKNAFVLAPWVFSKQMTHQSIVLGAVGGFGVFCLLASSIYTINDLADLEADRVHPRKRRRPLASGRVPVWAGKVLAGVLLTVALIGAVLGPIGFLATVLGYFALQIAYTFKLKKIAYVDVGCIAAGFVLRVVAGSFAVRVTPSLYMLACTLLLALFLGFGKRRHELAGSNAAKQRSALGQYSPNVLTWALAVTACSPSRRTSRTRSTPRRAPSSTRTGCGSRRSTRSSGCSASYSWSPRARRPSLPRRRCCGTCRS
jgi:decaprenyl-phosphate phosphoribosyltransferase